MENDRSNYPEQVKRALEKYDAEQRAKDAEREVLAQAMRTLAEQQDDISFEDVARESGLPLDRVWAHEQFLLDLVEQIRNA